MGNKCPSTFHFSLGWKVEKQWFSRFYWMRMPQNWKYLLRLSHLLNFSCKVLSKVIYELQFLFQIPFLIVQLIQAQVSLTRLNGFFNAEEIDKKAIGHKTKDETNALELDDSSFTWDISQHIPTISNINLNIKKSSMVAIVGQVFFS